MVSTFVATRTKQLPLYRKPGTPRRKLGFRSAAEEKVVHPTLVYSRTTAGPPQTVSHTT